MALASSINPTRSNMFGLLKTQSECLACSSALNSVQQLLPQSHYQNILCQVCEQDMSTKDKQVEVFSKLIDFFEHNQAAQGSSRNSSSINQTSSKMKIKDLIRLVLHVLNEVSGLSIALHTYFQQSHYPTQPRNTLLPNFTNSITSESPKPAPIQMPKTTQPQSFPSSSQSSTTNMNANYKLQDSLFIKETKKPIYKMSPSSKHMDHINLLNRRSNANSGIMAGYLNDSLTSNQLMQNQNQRRARTESDETDEFDLVNFRVTPQIRRHSVKTKSLLATQPLLKRATVSAALSQKNSIAMPSATANLLDEMNSFFTHPSPTAKHSQSKQSTSILSSTNCFSGTSDLVVQASQIEIQLDGSFNEKDDISKTLVNPLRKQTDRLLNLPDSQDEPVKNPHKDSFPFLNKNPKSTLTSQPIKGQHPRNQNTLAYTIIPRSMKCNNLITSFKDKQPDTLHQINLNKTYENIHTSNSPSNSSMKMTEKPRSQSTNLRNYQDQQVIMSSQGRANHPRSKSSLSNMVVDNSKQSFHSTDGATSIFSSKQSQNTVSTSSDQIKRSKMILTRVQERAVVKKFMRECYGDNCNNGFHKCKYFWIPLNMILQVENLTKLFIIEDYGELNEVKFIISGQWWRNWLEYVSFNEVEEEIGVQRGRPEEIINAGLLKQRQINDSYVNNYYLKDDLLEHYDYEAIPKKLFEYLNEWYQIDYQLVRFLKQDPSKPFDQQVFLDLYPEKSLGLTLPFGIRTKQPVYKSKQPNNTAIAKKKENLVSPKLSNSVVCHAEEKSSVCNVF